MSESSRAEIFMSYGPSDDELNETLLRASTGVILMHMQRMRDETSEVTIVEGHADLDNRRPEHSWYADVLLNIVMFKGMDNQVPKFRAGENLLMQAIRVE